MRYSKYFKPEQKILLRALTPDSASGRLDALTVYFHSEGSDYFDLVLPYQFKDGENFPFFPGMPFELLSDAMGLGVRLTGSFLEQRDGNLIRLRVNNDLQIFQRRLADRIDITIGLRYTKGQGTLRTFREQWEKNIRILEKTPDFSKLPPFPRAKVNLSKGGIRFRIKTPVKIADFCLLLLRLEEKEAPICALAEVVWLDTLEADGRQMTGMQFLSILESDQKRIMAFIKKATPMAAVADKKTAG
jgi:c-di-GMP-binding flagellar brake protein YcgR